MVVSGQEQHTTKPNYVVNIALNWLFGVLFQVLRLFLEILESAELQGVIFFETVVNYVSTEHLFGFFLECRSMDIL